MKYPLGNPRHYLWEPDVFCLLGVGLGYVQGSYFSQIPAPMDHEFVENEEGTCKHYLAGRNCSTSTLCLGWDQLPAQSFHQMKDLSLYLVNPQLWALAHWTGPAAESSFPLLAVAGSQCLGPSQQEMALGSQTKSRIRMNCLISP